MRAGQAADVVVALDEGRLSDDRHRFDDVRIERSLREKVHRAELRRFLLEYVDEGRPDDFALRFRIG